MTNRNEEKRLAVMTHKGLAEKYALMLAHLRLDVYEYESLRLICYRLDLIYSMGLRRHWREHLKRKTATEARDERLHEKIS